MSDQRNGTTPSEDEETARTALARARLYRWYSRLLHATGGAPADGDGALRKVLAALPVEVVRDVLAVRPRQVAAEASRLFSHTLTPDCPPYETEYGASHIFRQAQQLADIAGFYQAFGVTLAPTAHERVDHLAVELEFLAYLGLKESYALTMGRPEHAQRCREAQGTFLNDHLGRWVAAFSGRVARKLPHSLSARMADGLVGFVAWDCHQHGVQPETIGVDERGQAEAPETGDGMCGPCGAGGRLGCV